MKVQVLKEEGYEEATLGFSLSYNTSIERTKVILPKYAFGVPGENKFLESIYLWVMVQAPRYFWQEADTYRISTKQSESTIHTICKKLLTQEDFQYPVYQSTLDNLNTDIDMYKTISNDWKNKFFEEHIKNNLPEGFLQKRVWVFDYKCLQNIYGQRYNHRLSLWHLFIKSMLEQIEHPEFIIKGE